MAKIRRTIRKTKQPSEATFDEQFWPVMLALFILGGFLAGTVLAYLRFNERVWYANAWTWLVAIPVVICTLIWVLRKVESRALRRGVQFSAVLCMILHLIMFIISIETNIFGRIWAQFTEVAETRNEQEPLIEPEYDPVQFESQPDQQQDLLRPVETQTPETELEELNQEQQEPVQPTQPRPTPTPEQEVAVQPNEIQRPTPAETVPRQAEQTSQLSRQTAQTQPQPSQRVEQPQPASQQTPSAAAVAAETSQVRRQTAQARADRAMETPEATAEAQQPRIERARPTEQTTPQTVTAAIPTMPRRVNTPRAIAHTQVDSNVPPTAAEQTQPQELTPSNTLARQQATASPQSDRVATQPTPTPAANVEATSQRREQQSVPQPTISQTPTPVSNQRTRATPRPDAATMAAEVGPSQTPSMQTNPAMEAASNAIARTQATTQAASQAISTAPTESAPSPEPSVTRTARSSSSPSPAATTAPSASQIARSNTTTRNTPSTSTAAEPTVSTASSAPSTTLAAAASAVRQQAVTSPEVAASEGSFRADSSATVPALTGATPSPRRISVSAPSLATSTAATTAGRSASQAAPNLTTAASDAAQAIAESSSGSANRIAAASTNVSRQATSGASMAGATPASGGPQLSASPQVVSSHRASTSNVPTINSASPPSNSPARTSNAAELAASPVNIDSPATAQMNAGEAALTPEASRTAMTRSLNGVSGVGQAANLDRSLEAADSPSLVASGSAQRAESTQNTPTGAALSPSAPALVRHSLAGAERPSASALATTVEAATIAGSRQPAELTASSSGTLTRADANASPGAVTAAAGQVQVDLGPTRVVSGGGASRAAGGGQPDLNPSAQAQQLARSNSGGTPEPTLASTAVAAEVAAPPGTGGGQPTPQGIAPALADVGRGEPAPTEIGSGAAPSAQSDLIGSPAAAELAGGTPTRADGGPQMPDLASVVGGASGGDEDEDEEERARRLARRAMGGAPQIALRAELTPGMAAGSSGQPAAAEVVSGAEAGGGDLGRATPTNGMLAASGDAGPAAGPELAGGGGELAGAVVVRRAEATDGFMGAPEVGGGTSSPSRASPSQSFTANIAAAVATVAGAPGSSGSTSGSSVDTAGPQAAPLTGGRHGTPVAATIGAAPGQEMLDGVASSGTLAGTASQSRSAAASDGPSAGDDVASAAPIRRTTTGPIGVTGSLATTIDVPSAPSTITLATAALGESALGSDLGPMSRQSPSAVPVEIDALEGPGGLGNVVAADVGQNSRRAREDSLQVQSRATRFIRQDVGGLPSINTAAVVAADAFRGRSKPGDSSGSMGSAAGQQSDKAIELGLAYLARQQLADGSWNLQAVDHRAQLVSDTAATGLALLAFQGYGYTHVNNEYASVVKRGIDYLVQHQKENGDLFIPLDDESNRSVWLYSHGIAALAMCEAYGMTQDPALKGPAQRSLDFIVASQHKEYGGWRYAPNLESDTSVTGWMTMALKSGDLANLEVPTETYVRIERWLDVAQGSRSERHKYRYNPYAPNTETQAHGRDASETMTAVGLLMRFYTGWRRDNQNMARGADYLLESPPAIGTARNPKRDTYYWYYATQVMFHMGGEHWQKWNEQLRPVLVDSQIQSGEDAGSWNPRFPVADRWAPHAGRLYVTALNLLSLEVHYRHLPLYDETGR
ncbi:MAG: hypothetical protein H6822_01075 [Planctomycetaceae bacterium]|nr:hypothetical protein [Planctomycetales bacterium]MCB9920738.1 hypothetical protein [Planctomycetaceae bacterium]